MVVLRHHGELHRQVETEIGLPITWHRADNEFAALVAAASTGDTARMLQVISLTNARIGPETAAAFSARLASKKGSEADLRGTWLAILSAAASSEKTLIKIRDGFAGAWPADSGSFELIRNRHCSMKVLAPLPAFVVANLGGVGEYRSALLNPHAAMTAFIKAANTAWGEGVGEVLTSVDRPYHWWSEATLPGSMDESCAVLRETIDEHGLEATMLAALLMNGKHAAPPEPIGAHAARVAARFDSCSPTAVALAVSLSHDLGPAKAVEVAASLAC